MLSASGTTGPATIDRRVSGPHLNIVVQRTSDRPGAGHTSAAKGRAGLPPWVDEGFLQSLVSTLYAPVDGSPVPQPTPSEVRRQTFWLEFVGHYWVGAPRFANQSATIHIYSDGRNVTSNQSLLGRAQLLVFPPADPTATPTTLDPVAGQVTGLFSYFAANVLQSGTVLFADTTNPPGVLSNDPSMLDHGLPSKLQFTIDPNGVSGGIYATPTYTVTTAAGQSSPAAGGSGGAVANHSGAGQIDIKYIPTNHLLDDAKQSGTVIVRMQGLINTTGVLNPIYKGIN